MSNNNLFNKIGILDPNANSINPLTNKNYSNKNSYKNLSKIWSGFPMYKIKDKAIKAINNNQVVLITSGTGSGKTVLTPKFALHTYGYNGKIAITNPKKIPTKSAAEFAAKTLDVKLGEEVGYKYRGSPKDSMSKKTKLLYCTDGYIMATMKSDPLLKDFDMIIIDEAHERNVNIDLLMVLIKRAMLVRRDLKLIIMSATIDVSKFVNYFPKKDFKFEYVESPGETFFPVEEFYLNKSIYNFDKDGILRNMDDIINQAVNTVIYLLLTTGGGSSKNNKNNKNNNKQPPEDILVFLTSGAELNKACSLMNKILDELSKLSENQISEYIEEFLKDCPFNKCVFKDNRFTKNLSPYCGELTGSVVGIDKDYITNAVKYKNHPNGPYNRKVVFSTEAAESSITIKGLKYVIDSGLSLQSKYYPKKRLDTLEKRTISKASHKQRAGRVGRTSEGFCFNLFSENDYKKFSDYTAPPIYTENITTYLLDFFKNGMVSSVKIPFSYKNKNMNNKNNRNNRQNNNLTKTGKIKSINLSAFLSEFLDKPLEENVRISLKELYSLGALKVDKKTKIAKLSIMGDAIGEFRNIKPHYAKMAILSNDFYCRNEVSDLVALLTVFEDNISDIIPDFKNTDIAKKLEYEKYRNRSKSKSINKELSKAEEKYNKVKKGFSHKYGDHLSLINIFHNFKLHEYDTREYNKNSNSFKVVVKKKGKTHDWCNKHFITKNACKKLGYSDDKNRNNVFQMSSDIRKKIKELYLDIKYKSLFGNTIRIRQKNKKGTNTSGMRDGKIILFDETEDNIMMVIALASLDYIAYNKSKTPPHYILCSADDKSFKIDIDQNSFLFSRATKSLPKLCIYGDASDYGRPALNIVSRIPQKIINVIKDRVEC